MGFIGDEAVAALLTGRVILLTDRVILLRGIDRVGRKSADPKIRRSEFRRSDGPNSDGCRYLSGTSLFSFEAVSAFEGDSDSDSP